MARALKHGPILFGVIAVVAMISGPVTAGVAQAALTSHGPGRLVLRAVAAGPDTSSYKPEPCWVNQAFQDCTSSDPTVTFIITSVGDTSSCTFQTTTDWNDGNPPVTQTYPGGPDGSTLATFKNTYITPATYQVSVTGSVTSGGCSTFSPTTVSFTLVGTGIYSDFRQKAQVDTALSDGWGVIGDVAGLSAAANCRGSYTASTGSTSAVEAALSAWDKAHSVTVPWLSFWTIDAPPPGKNPATVGLKAGEKAATTIEDAEATRAASPAAPTYVVLDPEGSKCGNPGADREAAWAKLAKSKYQALVRGWVKGVEEDPDLKAAVYLSKSQYQDKGGAGYRNVFLAATTKANTIPVHPGLAAANVLGYIAYYAACATADDDVAKAEEWNTIYNTLQFGKNSAICPP